MIDSQGRMTEEATDFRKSIPIICWGEKMSSNKVGSVHCERTELHHMAKATEIATNVWTGLTADPQVKWDEAKFIRDTFDLEIHTTDTAMIPMPFVLNKATKGLELGHQCLDFPSSGSLMPPSDDDSQVDDLVRTVRWMYTLANPGVGAADESTDRPRKAHKIIILCPDGYTESSFLLIAYLMYAEGLPAHDAWLKLHCGKERNFFAYHTDVMFLRSVEKRLLRESPHHERAMLLSRQPAPSWFSAMDGSLPSRITPYMYLGNLSHANNPGMLWELGIRRILSIGEPFHWSRQDVERFGERNIMYIGQVHDNGIDSLTQEFDGCLEFIRASFLHPFFFFFF